MSLTSLSVNRIDDALTDRNALSGPGAMTGSLLVSVGADIGEEERKRPSAAWTGA